jgi:hypothetical protein
MAIRKRINLAGMKYDTHNPNMHWKNQLHFGPVSGSRSALTPQLRGKKAKTAMINDAAGPLTMGQRTVGTASSSRTVELWKSHPSHESRAAATVTPRRRPGPRAVRLGLAGQRRGCLLSTNKLINILLYFIIFHYFSYSSYELTFKFRVRVTEFPSTMRVVKLCQGFHCFHSKGKSSLLRAVARFC